MGMVVLVRQYRFLHFFLKNSKNFHYKSFGRRMGDRELQFCHTGVSRNSHFGLHSLNIHALYKYKFY